MSMKIYVGNLSWGIDEDKLQEAFEQFGDIEDVKIIKDHATKRSRGFGFVTFTDAECGQAAIFEMDGHELDGRNLKVNEAKEKPSGGGFRGRGGGGGGGGGGGRNFKGRDGRRHDNRGKFNRGDN
jgi:RNA recognition motif-containing protein